MLVVSASKIIGSRKVAVAIDEHATDHENGVVRQGPIPVNTLYTSPQSLFGAPASDSNLATTGVNHDTLLTVGWLDLGTGPQVLQVPDFSDRYYSVQFTDPFNVNFAYVSTRITGTQVGDHLITGPTDV